MAHTWGSPRGTPLLDLGALLWQVSCSGDQVQLVLNGGPEELLLTVWERGQPAASYPPGTLQSHGCPPAARQHLHHALRMLQSI